MGKIYHNNEKSTWEDDSNSELYLMPGTAAYQEYVSDLQNHPENRPEDDFHTKLEEQNADLQEDRVKEQIAYNLKKEPMRRKARQQMRKRDIAKDVEKTVEKDLHRDVKPKEFEDEIFDDGVTDKNFVKAAVVDFKEEHDEKQALERAEQKRQNRPLPFMKKPEAGPDFSDPYERLVNKYS